TPGTDRGRYIHGSLEKGSFTFLGGHDPEDFSHLVGDPQTDVSIHANSPGYRLILNNVLFPSMQKKEKKT
ncbi:MAG TPA: asparagine synthetase B, partial [bacterium]|nr:asparagine synthetase B [bacterium]